ncbi:MAG TPA: MFS transporter [Candidatus Limnocylindrales bacterium]|nr:MFS transporter [Candidatus Limnocylindrales bacterium]
MQSPAGAPVPTPPAPVPPSSVVRPAIVYALLFGGVAAYVPYIAVYLRSTGLDLGTVGVLIALQAAVGLVAAPTWGALADSLGDVRAPILAASLLAAGAATLMAVVSGPLALTVSIVLLASGAAGIIPMVDSKAVRMVGQRDRFGQARAWGSAAFIVIAFASGAAIGRFGPVGMFVLYGPMLVATGLAGYALLRLPGERAGRSPASRSRGRVSGAMSAFSLATIVGAIRQPVIGRFFVGSIVVWTAFATLLTFVSLRIVQLGGDATVIGATWSIAALTEIPLMFAFPNLARRFGAERLVIVGALALALRAAAIAVVTSPWAVVAVSPLGGIGFAFFYVGTVTWVAGAVPREVQATAQGVFTGTAVSIGAIGGSILGGLIGAAFSLPILFGLAAAGGIVGMALVWRAIGGSRLHASPPGAG